MKLPFHAVVIDSVNPETLAQFWSAVTGYTIVRTSDVFTALVDPDGEGLMLLLQKVPEPKVGKARAHLDLEAADPEAAAVYLESLGGKRLNAVKEIGIYWVVMQDPEGNEFCLVKA